MKLFPYEISKEALSDINEIWLYTKDRWSVEQADRYYNLIFDEIDFICNNPGAGKSKEHIRKGYKASKVKSHLIFYRVVNNVVEIIRILHENMDIENRLSDS